jgi:succinoglycan biosynthesis transport protein ExoP
VTWDKSIGTHNLGPFLELMALVRRRIRLIAGTVISTLCVVAAYLVFLTPSYQAMVEIFVDPQALQIAGRGITRTDTSASIDLAGIDSQPQIFTSTRLLEKVIAELHLDEDPALARGSTSPATTLVTVLGALRQRIVVRRVEASLVFQITVTHPVARQAARIANAIAATYFSLDSSDRTKAVRRASATLLEQSALLRDDLVKAEAAVERFKAQAGLISTGESGLIVSQQLRDLYTQISVYEGNLARLTARRKELAKLSAAQVAGEAAAQNGGTPEAIESPVIAALRAQYAAISQNEAQLERMLGDRHPDLANAREQRRAVLQEIQNELSRIARSADEEYRRAQGSLEGLRKRAETLVQSQIASNEAEIKLRQLESEASAIRVVYDSSLGRVKELQQQQQFDTNNSRVISDALEPVRPFGAPKALVLLAGTLFGVVLGIGLAYLVELFSGILPSAAAVEAVSRVPVVAEISKIGPNGLRSANDNSTLSGLAQSLRAHFKERQTSVVLITGPSATDNARTADQLARVLAESGEGVLRCSGGLGHRAVASSRVGPPNFHIRNGLIVNDSSKFVIVDMGAAASLEIAGNVDAAFVVVEPGRITRDELKALSGVLESCQGIGREGWLGLVCLRPAQWTPSWVGSPRTGSGQSVLARARA